MHCNHYVIGMNNNAYFSVFSSCSVTQNVLRNELHSVVVSSPLLSELSLL